MKKILLIALIAIVMGMGSVAVFIYYRNLSNPKTTYVSSILAEITPEDLVKQSSGIVLGKVEKTQAIKIPSKIRANKEDIVTIATVKVEKYLANSKNLSASYIDVQVLGGTVGNETMVAEDSPTFEQGEQAIIFLNEMDASINAFTVYAGAQGKFTIQADGSVGNDKERVYFEKVFGKDMILKELEDKIASISNSLSN